MVHTVKSRKMCIRDRALTGWTDVTNGTSFTTKSGDTVTVALVNTTKGNIATASGSALAVVGA